MVYACKYGECQCSEREALCPSLDSCVPAALAVGARHCLLGDEPVGNDVGVAVPLELQSRKGLLAVHRQRSCVFRLLFREGLCIAEKNSRAGEGCDRRAVDLVTFHNRPPRSCSCADNDMCTVNCQLNQRFAVNKPATFRYPKLPNAMLCGSAHSDCCRFGPHRLELDVLAYRTTACHQKVRFGNR